MLEAKNQMGSLILIFITIIIGVTLISALGDTIFEAVNIPTTTNETVDITTAINATGGFEPPVELSLVNDDLESVSELRMFNGTVAVQNTDYRINLTEGGLTFLDTEFTASYNQTPNWSTIDYTHYGDDKYVQGSSVSRTILNNLILIFVVFGLVIWVYAMVKKQWLDQIT